MAVLCVCIKSQVEGSLPYVTVATASEVAIEEGGCTLQRNIMTTPHDAKRDIAWCASSDIYDGYKYQNDIDALLS